VAVKLEVAGVQAFNGIRGVDDFFDPAINFWP